MSDYLSAGLFFLLLFAATVAWRNGKRADRYQRLYHRERGRRWLAERRSLPPRPYEPGCPADLFDQDRTIYDRLMDPPGG